MVLTGFLEELLNIIAKRMSGVPQFKHLLGPTLRISQEWLIPIFPYRAPPHYERYG